MAFADYEQLAEPLSLPYRGKVYRLPEVGIEETIRINLAATDEASTDNIDAETLEQILLGDALTQMRADNVPAPLVARAFRTALAEVRYGRAIAEQIWNLKGSDLPKAPSPTPEASVPSTSTDEASTTPSPAPGSGTKPSRPRPARSVKTPA